MYIGRVVGNVVSTHKNDRLAGKKLLLVRRMGLDDRPDGSVEVIALDVVDAGVGDTVLVVQEGSSARKIFNDQRIPVQAVVVGVVESVNVHGTTRKTAR
jgi:ethanolamine utilization protein EutN